MIKAINVLVEYMTNPIGIDIRSPRFNWQVQGIKQKAFHFALAGDLGTHYDSGVIDSATMNWQVPVQAKWQERMTYALTLYDEQGAGETVSGYYEIALGADNFKGNWIEPERNEIDTKKRYPASVLTKTFDLATIAPARLSITAKGIYVVFINGQRLPTVLAPGTFQSNKRQIYQTYDVSTYLHVGHNTLVVYLMDGWYRGSMENTGNRYRFGTKLGLLAQLDVAHQAIVVTDESWQASQAGPVRFSDLRQGETYDARKAQIKPETWHEVIRSTADKSHLLCSNMPLVKEHEHLQAVKSIAPNGEVIFDFGQNIAGYVSFSFTAESGQQIELSFGETLDKHGNFTIENFQNPKHDVYQKLTYIAKTGQNIYRPYGTYMGFRYARVTGLEAVKDFAITAIAIYTDLAFTGSFTCSNAKINKLVDNTVWSVKSNFIDIPTDCPTREKDGFTGDYQAFIHTAMYLTSCYGFSRRWLNELASAQFADGCLPMVAPSGRKRIAFDGAGGWCDALPIVALKIAERYDDYRAAEDVYPAIKHWVDFNVRRAQARTRLIHLAKPYHQYLVDTGMHWGEWLEPGANIVYDMAKIGMFGEPEVATAYFVVSARILTELATRMGETQAQAKYQHIADQAQLAYQAYALKHGQPHTKRMCRYVRPLALDLLPASETKAAAAALNELLIANHYHQNTGFLSTHQLPGVLTDYGYVTSAYKLLLHEGCPGWLYPVEQGATTIWEQWDGIDEKGDIHASFNHYSYGAIVGWLFDHCAGINVQHSKILIRPYPSALLNDVKCSYQSILGTITSAWTIHEDTVDVEIEIPGNASATVQLGNERYLVGPGKHHYCHSLRDWESQ